MSEIEHVRSEVVMGIGIDIDPMDALLACVRIAAGEVAYATYKVQSLEPDMAIGHPETIKRRPLSLGKDGEDPGNVVEEVTTEQPSLHVWIRVRQNSLERLAKFSKMALDAGVAQRQVELAEGAGDTLALELRKVFDELNLSAVQEAMLPDLVRSMLENLERPAIEAAQRDDV